VQDVSERQLPERRVVRDQEHRQEELDDAADPVRRQHHELARKAVGPHASDEEQHDAHERPRAEDEAELRGAAAHVEDGERERDEDQPIAERGGAAAEPYEPVGPVPERSEPAHALMIGMSPNDTRTDAAPRTRYRRRRCSSTPTLTSG
jgi:hypothetical protein